MHPTNTYCPCAFPNKHSRRLIHLANLSYGDADNVRDILCEDQGRQ